MIRFVPHEANAGAFAMRILEELIEQRRVYALLFGEIVDAAGHGVIEEDVAHAIGRPCGVGEGCDQGPGGRNIEMLVRWGKRLRVVFWLLREVQADVDIEAILMRFVFGKPPATGARHIPDR